MRQGEKPRAPGGGRWDVSGRASYSKFRRDAAGVERLADGTPNVLIPIDDTFEYMRMYRERSGPVWLEFCQHYVDHPDPATRPENPMLIGGAA